jgi:hypothetical protein
MTGEKTINWTLNVNIPGGPTISGSEQLTVQAYDMIELQIPAGTDAMEIHLEPSDNTKIKFLLIKAEPSGDSLTYIVSDGTTAVDGTSGAIVLDSPVHIYLGTGCVQTLPSPKNLTFTNGSSVPVSLQILVGRDAT